MLAEALKYKLHREFRLPPSIFNDDTRASYDALKKDDYMKTGDNYRFRAFSKGVLERNEISWDSNSEFFQGENLNKYMGGVQRSFPPLDTAAQMAAEQIILCSKIFSDPSSTRYHVGCHQIRITVSESTVGMPAPEGFHQDGFENIIIACMGSENICGGVTLLRSVGAISPLPFFSAVLEPGNALLLDDRAVEHYTTPITHRVPGKGYRDVIVLTFNKAG